MKRYCKIWTTLRRKNATLFFMRENSAKNKAHKSKIYNFQGIRDEIKS